uniref:Uncharacterized protein n=1 Tax=Pararge aegeria TaxID=116150 RepID=S4PV11_9NEOP
MMWFHLFRAVYVEYCASEIAREQPPFIILFFNSSDFTKTLRLLSTKYIYVLKEDFVRVRLCLPVSTPKTHPRVYTRKRMLVYPSYMELMEFFPDYSRQVQ